MKRNNVSKFLIHSLIHRLKKCYLGNKTGIGLIKWLIPIEHDPTTEYGTGQNKIQVKFFSPRLILNFLDQPTAVHRFKKFNLNLILACNIYVVYIIFM